MERQLEIVSLRDCYKIAPGKWMHANRATNELEFEKYQISCGLFPPHEAGEVRLVKFVSCIHFPEMLTLQSAAAVSVPTTATLPFTPSVWNVKFLSGDLCCFLHHQNRLAIVSLPHLPVLSFDSLWKQQDLHQSVNLWIQGRLTRRRRFRIEIRAAASRDASSINGRVGYRFSDIAFRLAPFRHCHRYHLIIS